MGELVFEQHPSHNWDYRIEPRKIYELTAESFRRTIRMLDKNKLCFEGLRIKIEADDLLFNVKIKKEDEGMHLVLLKEDFEKHSDSLQHLGRIQTKQKDGKSRVSRNSHPLVAKLFWRTRNALICDKVIIHTRISGMLFMKNGMKQNLNYNQSYLQTQQVQQNLFLKKKIKANLR